MIFCVLFMMGFLAASAQEPSTVRLVPWDEQAAELIEGRGHELRQCFKGAPRSSTDAYTFNLLLNEDGTVSTIRFLMSTDKHVESALACVSDQVVQIRFPAFEGGTRGVEFVLRPMRTQQTRLQR